MYKRACTPEEAALLDAHETAMIEQERRELDEIATVERESFFQQLRTEIAAAGTAVEPPQSTGIRHPGLEPGSGFSSDAAEGRQVPDQVRYDDDCDLPGAPLEPPT